MCTVSHHCLLYFIHRTLPTFCVHWCIFPNFAIISFFFFLSRSLKLQWFTENTLPSTCLWSSRQRFNTAKIVVLWTNLAPTRTFRTRGLNLTDRLAPVAVSPLHRVLLTPTNWFFWTALSTNLSIRHLAARWQTPSRSCTGTIRSLPTVNVACNKLYRRKLPALKRFATCALAAYAATRTTWKSLCALPAAPAHAASAFEFRCWATFKTRPPSQCN